MGMQAGGTRNGFSAEINVTPLVDVVLVLLIIFMVIVPMTQLGYDLAMPREATSIVPPDPDTRPVILGINAAECPVTVPVGPAGLPRACRVRLNREPVEVADLPARVGKLFRNRRPSERVLFLAAEESVNYEAVVRILDAAASGVADLKIGLVSDENLARPAGRG